MTEKQHFTVTSSGDYIHLVTEGLIEEKDLEAPANAAIALAEKTNVRKLLDDIRNVDKSGVSISVQAKGVGILWKLRAFDKVAVLLKDRDLGKIFFATLEALHVSSKFRGFYDEAEAITWLQAD